MAGVKFSIIGPRYYISTGLPAAVLDDYTCDVYIRSMHLLIGFA